MQQSQGLTACFRRSWKARLSYQNLERTRGQKAIEDDGKDEIERKIEQFHREKGESQPTKIYSKRERIASNFTEWITKTCLIYDKPKNKWCEE